MKSLVIKVLFGCAVIGGSFWATLWVLDQFNPRMTFDIAALPRAKFAETVEFKSNLNSAALISGWGNPEPWGCWSSGNESQVAIVPMGISRPNLKLYFTIRVFLAPKLPQQRIEVYSGNRQLGAFVVTAENAGDGSLSVGLGDLSVKNDQPFIIRFRLPDAISPSELQMSADTRRLAIGLVSIRLDS